MHLTSADRRPVEGSVRPDGRAKRPLSGVAFAAALRDGLSDVAYAYDGAFRPASSLSLAELAAYGIRPEPRAAAIAEPQTPASTPHAAPCAHPDVHADASSRLHHHPSMSGLARGANPRVACDRLIERVRREVPLRRPPSSGGTGSRARHLPAAARGLRVRARIGSAAIDVVVLGGGRFESVMQWTR